MGHAQAGLPPGAMLAAEKLDGRLTGSPGEKLAADYIVSQLQRIGAKPVPGFSDFRVPFEFTSGNRDGDMRIVQAHRIHHVVETKAGTVSFDVAKAVQEIKAGKVEFRVDKTGIIHAPVGKLSFGTERLKENADALIGAVLKAKPSAAKGKYVKGVALSSTMGPGIKVDETLLTVTAES